MPPDASSLSRIYDRRFDAAKREAKRRVWEAVVRHFLQRWIPRDAAVLDVGCGFGEFLNAVQCAVRVGIDLNPEVAGTLRQGTEFHCRAAGDLGFLQSGRFDVAFTSNFLEHLPDKTSVEELLSGIRRVLRPGGQLIAIGPNIRFLAGDYWDYWDHHVPLTDRSLVEALESLGFRILERRPRFLPYTIRSALPHGQALVRWYLRLPWLWPIFGRQFLVRASAEG